MAIDLDVHGNTKPLEAAVQAAVNRIRRQPIKITIDDKGATQPLGNMKRGADEFTKSMEAANARILAFGASMAIINGVGNAFKGMVKNLVEVEKALADINVVMGLSAQNLDKFSDGLFKVAKETGAAFRVAADAATEYARQGLSVEESLKRTRDALVLTRLTGMDSAEAVKSLTAAMNTYGNQIKDTTQLVSKFAAVDVKFAVSAEDFADAISRTGQSAKTAGVSIDELVGIVTSAQQQTARGGAVIGNALKTIFTKTGRTDTLNQLENLGIAVRDLEGNTLGAKRILSDLANTFDKLSEAQKAQITQTMGGLFHINILKAVLSDAAKQNGIMAEATRISAGATDEAIQKNEELRKTMSAVATETGLAIKQVSAQIGEIAIAPGMEKILNTVKSLAEGLSGVLGDGESTGNSFATGFLKGIGNVITGPGLVVLAGVFFKLFGQALKFTKESLTSLVGVTTEKQKQKAIEASLVTLFGQNAALNKEMLRTDIGRVEKEKILLALLKSQVAEATRLSNLTGPMAASLYRKGYGANLTPIGKKASGHIPNFAHPERAQAAQGGYAAGSIRSMNMPGEGPVIYNSAETVKNFAGFKQPAIMPPQSSKAGKNYQQAFGSIHGFDPYAAGGYIPNFIKPSIKLGDRPDITTRQQAEAAGYSPAAISARFGKGTSEKTTASNTSQLLPEGVKYLNPNSINYIGLSASLGPDTPKNSYYVSGGSQTSSGIYASPTSKGFRDSLNKGVPGAKVDVEFRALDSSDKQKAFGRMDDQINTDLQKNSQIIANKILNRFGKASMKAGDVGKDLPKNKMSVVSGHIFEAVTKSVLRQIGAAGAIADRPNELIDLGYNEELYELFGIKKSERKGRSGAEAKLNTTEKNVKSLARKIYSLHTGSHLKTKAYGHIPNFADPLSDAIGREKAAGVPVSQIRVGSHSALMSKGNPLGLGVTNTKDEPNGLRDVFGANGFVPNYAVGDIPAKIDRILDRIYTNLSKEDRLRAKQLSDQVKNGQISQSSAQKLMQNYAQANNYSAAQTAEAAKRLGFNVSETQEALKQLGFEKSETQEAIKQVSFARSQGGSGLLGRAGNMARGMGSGNAGMALMMGLPMAAGFLQDTVGGKAGATIGGGLSGAGTGASMGMIFGPLGIAIGGAVGGLYGFINGLNEAEEAARDKAVQDRKAAAQEFAQTGAQFLTGRIDPNQTLAKAGIGGEFYQKYQEQLGGKTMVEAFEMFSTKSKDSPEKGAIYDRLSKEFDPVAARRIMGGEKGIQRELLLKGLEGREKEVFRGKETLQKFGIQKETATGAELMEVVKAAKGSKIEELFNAIKIELQERLKTESEETKVAIRQLNLRKAMLTAQAKTNENLHRIKEASMMGEMNFKWMKKFNVSGNELIKSQIDYMEALNKASDKLESQTEELEGKTVQDILAEFSSSTNQQQLKSFLTNKENIQGLDISKAIKQEFQKLAEETGVIDLTPALTGLSYDELMKVLNAMADANIEIDAIRDRIVEGYEKEKEKLTNNYNITVKTAEENKKLNDAIGKRTELYKALAREFQYQDRFRSAEEKAQQTQNQLDDIRWRNANRYATHLEEVNRQLKEFDRNSSQEIQRQEAEMTKSTIDSLIQKYKELGLSADPEKFNKVRGSGKLSEISAKNLGIPDLSEIDKGFFEKEQERLLEENIHLDPKSDKARANTEQLKQLEIFQGLEEEDQKAKFEEMLLFEGQVLELGKKRLKNLQEINKERRKEIQEVGSLTFADGMKKGFSDMDKQVAKMDYELGERIPFAFADGLATAMTDAVNGTKSIKEGLMDAAMSFLQMIQQAMMQKMAYQMVGAMGFSRGGNVRNYSRGGGVPAMVSNGEYVMGRDAVAKYGGAFMHGMNAGGRIPGFSNGGSVERDLIEKGTIRRESNYSGSGEAGSALAANFGGGRGFKSGRMYQRKAMSGFFYSQSGNVGLAEDASAMQSILSEEERRRQEAEARRRAKKAKRRQLLGMVLGTLAAAGLSSAMQGGNLTSTAKAAGYGANTPAGVNMAIDSSGMAVSTLPGADMTAAALPISAGGSGLTSIAPTRSFNPFSWYKTSYGLSQQEPGLSYFFNNNRYLGGSVRKYASGGHISGKSGIDQIPAMLSEGEYVIRASSARQIGRPMLDRINAGKFNNGGAVSEIAGSSETGSTSGNTNNINISINMERGASNRKEDKQESSSSSKNPKDASNEEKENTLLAERIKQQVVSVIVEEQRPGGLLHESSKR